MTFSLEFLSWSLLSYFDLRFFPMIIDFFKNLKTHPQIISLSPHCYSPRILVTSFQALDFSDQALSIQHSGLWQPRHPQQMVSSGEWAGGSGHPVWSQRPGLTRRISQINIFAGSGYNSGPGCVLYVRDVIQHLAPVTITSSGTGHCPAELTLSHHIPENQSNSLILPSHEKQINRNLDHIWPRQGD